MMQTIVPPGESRVNAPASTVPATCCSIPATSADIYFVFKVDSNESAAIWN